MCMSDPQEDAEQPTERKSHAGELIPCLGGVCVRPGASGVGEHDGGETCLPVPEDVAVEEPGSCGGVHRI